LVTNIANAASLTAPAGSSAQSDPDKWNNLPANVSLIAIGDGSIQAGDLVFWSGHDGVATDSADFISSTGSKGMSCADNIKRGPVAYSFIKFGKGLPTKVLRFVSDTSLKLTADPPWLSSTGGTVTLTATVTALASGSGTSPTGTVSFIDQNDVVLCSAVTLASGSALCSTSISAAPDKVTATYSGDPNNAASEGAVTVRAAPLGSYIYQYEIVFQDLQCGQSVSLNFSATATSGSPTVSGSQSYTNSTCGPGNLGQPSIEFGPYGAGSGKPSEGLTGTAIATSSAPSQDEAYCTAEIDISQNINGTVSGVGYSYWQGPCSSGGGPFSTVLF
jgi:hypothetical protein